MNRSVTVQITIDIDDEEFNIPIDGEVNEDIENILTSALYEFEGLNIKFISINEATT